MFRLNHRSFTSLSLQTATHTHGHTLKYIRVNYIHYITPNLTHNHIPLRFNSVLSFMWFKCQAKAHNLTRHSAVRRCCAPRFSGALPRHAARGGPVHFPGGEQVHVHRPIGADGHRFGGLRRRYASSPREPSPLRHNWRILMFENNAGKSRIKRLFWGRRSANATAARSSVRPRGARLGFAVGAAGANVPQVALVQLFVGAGSGNFSFFFFASQRRSATVEEQRLL